MTPDALKALLAGAVFFMCICGVAFADDYPCPSKRASCWQVKIAKATFGERALIAKARSCGWTEGDIARIRKQCGV